MAFGRTTSCALISLVILAWIRVPIPAAEPVDDVAAQTVQQGCAIDKPFVPLSKITAGLRIDIAQIPTDCSKELFTPPRPAGRCLRRPLSSIGSRPTSFISRCISTTPRWSATASRSARTFSPSSQGHGSSSPSRRSRTRWGGPHLRLRHHPGQVPARDVRTLHERGPAVVGRGRSLADRGNGRGHGTLPALIQRYLCTANAENLLSRQEFERPTGATCFPGAVAPHLAAALPLCAAATPRFIPLFKPPSEAASTLWAASILSIRRAVHVVRIVTAAMDVLVDLRPRVR